MHTSLKENLTREMKKKGWRAKPLCRAAGVNDNTIYNILRGQSKTPSANKLSAIAKILGVRANKLIYGDNYIEQELDALEKIDFDGLVYSGCVSAILQATKNLEKELDKIQINKYAHKLYLYAMKKDGEADYDYAEMLVIEAKVK